MEYQAVFKRYELKYILNSDQKQRLLEEMDAYMSLDQYGHATIRNIYFDTENCRLIRHSLEKPAYKEKLRLRSYSRAACSTPVFVELKKKYQGVVYKRRCSMPEEDAMNWLCGNTAPPLKNQITAEIEYFRQYYATLRPTVFLSYERDAYYCRSGGDFRITLDNTILCRSEALSLAEDVWGTPLLPEDKTLLELKTSGGIPLWMTRFLTREHIYKASFSKYGTAYTSTILPTVKEVV